MTQHILDLTECDQQLKVHIIVVYNNYMRSQGSWTKKYTIIVCISACIYSKERMIIFQITCDFRHTGNMGGNKSWLYHNSLCVTVIMFSSVNVETNLFYYYYSI